MTEDTLRQALTSTARVACAVALVGCVPKATPDDSVSADVVMTNLFKLAVSGAIQLTVRASLKHLLAAMAK